MTAPSNKTGPKWRPARIDPREQRVKLLSMANFGRVTTLPGRNGPVIDFSPDIRGRARYLWSFYGRAFESVEEAESIRGRINHAAKNIPLKEAIDQFRSSRSQTDSVWEMCEQFIEAAKSMGSLRTGENYTERTIYHYRQVLKRARPFFDSLTMRNFFQPQPIAEFRAWFHIPKEQGGRGLQSDTEMANAMIALRAMVRWYQTLHPEFDVRWPSTPTKLTIAKRDRKRTRSRDDRRGRLKLKLPDVVRITSLIPEPKQPIFWCMFFTQCRITEARAVLGCDYDNGRIYIERSASSKSPNATITDKTKTDHDGGYLMPEFVQELIAKHCQHTRFDERVPLFRNPDVRAASTMWGEDAIYATWRAATELSGLPWVPPYQSMKHTQVSALRAAGISIDDIVEQCRWASPAMMAHYDDARDERRDAVVVKLGELALNALDTSAKAGK